MGQKPDSSPSERFIRDLRNGLNHFYDPDFMRRSPLASLFGVGGRFDTPSALQTVLNSAIESLRPKSNTPNKSHIQAIYDILLYRYVQQIRQEEIASQMGISVRQLRRQQNVAILELACKLWNQFDLDNKPDYAPAASTVETVSPKSESEKNGRSQIAEELSRLSATSLPEETDLAAIFPEVLTLIKPLAERSRSEIVYQPPHEGLVSVHPVVLQEILLNLLGLAIHYLQGTAIRLDIAPSDRMLIVQVSGSPTEPPPPEAPEIENRKEVVRQLVELSRGTVKFDISDRQFRASVAFPSARSLSVLVIDDNPEIVTVMQRFAAETRWRITGINDPKSVLEQAVELAPNIIVLDIMMPQIDGLQVLSSLKHHPALGKIPVIICSVLPQKELAGSLGASGFIQKPIRRDDFIAALSQYGWAEDGISRVRV